MCWICRRTALVSGDHILDMTEPTRQAKQNQPVDDQDRPEYRQVEDLEPAAEETNGNSLGGRVPELELW
jgi:hypothetical protein